MKIWALSDIHLNSTGNRGMQEFGAIWENHHHLIAQAWRKLVRPRDIVLVPGDISWASGLQKALKDLKIIDSLPGTKIIVRGNHDHWWDDLIRLSSQKPSSIYPLEGNALVMQGEVFCGTGGWLAPNDPCFDNLDFKFYKRELSALEMALEDAMRIDQPNGIHLLLHFPPFTTTGKETEFFKLIQKYPVKTCTYGHFHIPEEWDRVPKGWIDGTFYQLASTDYLKHHPTCIWDTGEDQWAHPDLLHHQTGMVATQLLS